MFSEIRNDYHFGPGYEGGTPEDGLLAGITIDGWQTDDDGEEGHVIAQVLLSVHGDIMVAWTDNGARMNEPVLEAISEAKEDLKELWAEIKEV